ncbi:FGGY family carbohydrate kinase [Hansschlegelia plantiphila]|uniref:ATP:glycerol 3-phosphotransferase n=1 Tax=Hansschlegelia plantiphila TaxID=374655 RepID=A0A9W6J2Y0_9HYPH|nr:FGGY family carbohydrate kinase [Hansschlegelia plantiphila]GLK68324.1 carbohydrate kinase [Hansschlegelia plantiphila]
MLIAAIDQGTTSTRVLVADTDAGTAEIAYSIRHRQTHPAPGLVEHDPEELLANIRACLAAAGPVDAIAIANQGESCLAWDAETGAALSPVIVWQDNRTAETLATLGDAGAALALERAGLPLDPYFSAAKLGSILTSSPEAQAAHAAGRLRLGTTDAFFLDRLAGVFATDVTTASRTSLMNLVTAQWDTDLCAMFGVPVECLPEIRTTVGGFGSYEGLPIVAAMVDQQAALYGHGCRKPGDAKITFGTGAFALAVTGGDIVRAPEMGLLPTVAWATAEGRLYAVDGGVYDAGSAIEWAGRIGLVDDLSELDAFEGEAAIDQGLVFVPALSGLACPYWDRSAASLFLGMSGATTKQDMRKALLEGVALRAAEVVAAIAKRAPIGPEISIDGGLARSRYFAQFLADSLSREVVVSDFDERTAFGAAALAALAFGIELEPPAGAKSRRFTPRAEGVEVRRARFADAVSRCRNWRG